ncbi:substrate-binding domain-containing protein [Gloeomargarita sp.]
MTVTMGKPRLPCRQLRRCTLLSLLFGAAGLVVVAGTELQQALLAMKPEFERRHPGVQLDLYFRGSQALANDYLDNRYQNLTPTILIPANGEILVKLAQDWQARERSEPFYGAPKPIAKTFLVGIAWPQRGRVLFPQGRFDWGRVVQALRAGQWVALGALAQWGSFDFRMTDPLRSNK